MKKSIKSLFILVIMSMPIGIVHAEISVKQDGNWLILSHENPETLTESLSYSEKASPKDLLALSDNMLIYKNNKELFNQENNFVDQQNERILANTLLAQLNNKEKELNSEFYKEAEQEGVITDSAFLKEKETYGALIYIQYFAMDYSTAIYSDFVKSLYGTHFEKEVCLTKSCNKYDVSDKFMTLKENDGEIKKITLLPVKQKTPLILLDDRANLVIYKADSDKSSFYGILLTDIDIPESGLVLKKLGITGQVKNYPFLVTMSEDMTDKYDFEKLGNFLRFVYIDANNNYLTLMEKGKGKSVWDIRKIK